MSEAPELKKRRLEEMFDAPAGNSLKSPEEMKKAYDIATQAHPFVDLAQHRMEISGDAVFSDAEGNVVGVLLRDCIPSIAAQMASNVLRPAASRTSLRANIFGGEAPMSGIAGYYDYSGSPVELKCRKTSFTCEVIKTWPDVFPLVEYVSSLYRAVAPTEWSAQDQAIPDIVRVNNSPFSTLTINQRFRTASHTDAGDFDAGYGVLAVLEGDFDGLHLGLTDFQVCFHMQPRDVLIFNTHHFHANTELERFAAQPDWNRLTCVFYYRSSLGEHNCMNNYLRRLAHDKTLAPSKRSLKVLPTSIPQKDNGENYNRPAPVHKVTHTPFLLAASCIGVQSMSPVFFQLHKLLIDSKGKATPLHAVLSLALFGEESCLPLSDGLPERTDEKPDVSLTITIARSSANGGFSESTGAVDAAERNHTMLQESMLKDALGGDTALWRLWKEARELWLQLVKRDWDHMLELNPDRVDFSWKNKSDMNWAFFDLCDIAKQVMLQLLQKEVATKTQENAFWLCFAGHLYHSCEADLQMVKDAMSMRKLNVKLKDYTFGGTRYFVDMPKEEQERRMLRKKRIEEARRNNNRVQEDAVDNNWLENDDFDYQSEACTVQYAAQGWPLPALHAASRVSFPAIEHVVKMMASVEVSIDIVVVVPTPALSAPHTTPIAGKEYQRLTSNAAAKRSIKGTMQVPSELQELVPGSVWVPAAGVRVRFMSTADVLTAGLDAVPCNLVVLRHCLSYLDDNESSRLVACATKAAVTINAECVASCRSEYRIPQELWTAHNTAATAAYPQLLSSWVPNLPQSRLAGQTTFPAHVRTKGAIVKRYQAAKIAAAGAFHFPFSPRNTTAWVFPKL